MGIPGWDLMANLNSASLKVLGRVLDHIELRAIWNEAEFNLKFERFIEKVCEHFPKDLSVEKYVRWIEHDFCDDFCELKILSCDHPDELSVEKIRTLLLSKGMPEDNISMLYQILNDNYAASIVRKVPAKSRGSETIMYYAGHLWYDLAAIFDFREIDTMPDLDSEEYKSKITEAHEKIEERYDAIMKLRGIMELKGYNLPLPVVNSAIRSCFKSKIQLDVFYYLVQERSFAFFN